MDPVPHGGAPGSLPAPTPRRPLRRRVRWLPATRLGWWSLRLGAAFAGFLVLRLALVASGQSGGDTFFSNLLLGLLGLGAGASAIAAGLVALFAVVRRGERSLVVFFVILIGLSVLVLEIADHASPH